MNDEAESNQKDDSDSKQKDADSKQKDDSGSKKKKDKSESTPSKPLAPPLGKKVFRVFLFTFLGAFLTGLLFAADIATGLRVDFDLLGAIKLGLISGILAALLRALAGLLPVFADDTAGRRRKA